MHSRLAPHLQNKMATYYTLILVMATIIQRRKSTKFGMPVGGLRCLRYTGSAIDAEKSAYSSRRG